MTIDQAIDPDGPGSIWPPAVLAAPRSWWSVVGMPTGDDGRVVCDGALTPVFFAARTGWRVVRDRASGHSDLRSLCPACGDALIHAADHDTRHRFAA